MRVIAVLFGPALLAVALMEGMARFAPPTEVSVEQPALAWSGRVFTSEEQFARWLASRGGSYERWQARHPESPWRTRTVAASRSDGSFGRIRSFGLAIVVGSLAAAAAFLLTLGARRHAGAGSRLRARAARFGRYATSTVLPLAVELAADVLRGAGSFTRSLGAGLSTSWRAGRRGASHGVGLVAVGAHALDRRIDAALAGALVVFRAGGRRLAGASRSADMLANRVDRLTVGRSARAAVGFGAIAAVSGALGIGVAIVLQ